jgi:hypothetical protein
MFCKVDLEVNSLLFKEQHCYFGYIRALLSLFATNLHLLHAWYVARSFGLGTWLEHTGSKEKTDIKSWDTACGNCRHQVQ